MLAQPETLKAADAAAKTAPASAHLSLSAVQLLPVIPNPGKIVCMGLNYADHAKEGGNARPEYPKFFHARCHIHGGPRQRHHSA
jgi:2-keto-4-pentenoate hydratase/2-oxohepta-3-ene-1,7-dioic acid hydratase in catechol pathway